MFEYFNRLFNNAFSLRPWVRTFLQLPVIKMNHRVQRYYPGHHNYSEASSFHANEYFKCTFGQILDGNGEFLHYTMERRDTLIPEGTYHYCFYNSPVNGWVVLLKDVVGFSFIEHHPANWPYQLKGCTAHGLAIDVHTPMLLNSRSALNPWFAKLVKSTGKVLAGPVGTIIDGDFGTFIYETLPQLT